MDKEHPIPQEVSTYEFRLVGDMTIKQFMQVAGGALISLLLYSSGIPPYVKWPLIIISFLTGIALAFFPIEDRPLSKWIVLFLKAIYSPTIYVWNKNATKHDYFQPENDQLVVAPPTNIEETIKSQPPTPQTSPTDTDQTSPTVPIQEIKGESSQLDTKEQEFLSKVTQEFTIAPVVEIPKSPPPPLEPATPRKDVVVPANTEVKVEPQQKHDIYQTTQQPVSSIGSQVSASIGQVLPQASGATFSASAAPPSPPTRPNVIVGQVIDSQGGIVDGAILEIKDAQGRSVRALRTNRLGHFMIVTPLLDGDYQIQTEKDNYQFSPVSFKAEDRIIPPIEIRAK